MTEAAVCSLTPVCMCDMTHSYVWHDPFIMGHDSCICVILIIRMCIMSHSYVWHDSYVRHDSFINATRLIYMWNLSHSYVWHPHSYAWHDSLICVTWLIRMSFVTAAAVGSPDPVCKCDMTYSYMWHDFLFVWFVSFICVMCVKWLNIPHSYVWHDSFICVTWLIHVWWHDSFVCVTWPIHVCDMTPPCEWHDSLIWGMSAMSHAHVWHDSFMCETRLIHMNHVDYAACAFCTYECVMSHIWMSHVTHVNESCHTY